MELTGQLNNNSKLFMKNTNQVETSSCTNSNWQKLSTFCRNKWEELKNQLVSRLSSEFPEVQSRLVRLAVIEAEALASTTSVPYLVLPTLAEEKVMGLRQWTAHQRAMKRPTRMVLVA